MKKRKSPGVSLFAFSFIVFSICWTLLMVVSTYYGLLPDIYVISAFIYTLLLGCAGVLAGLGVLVLRPWARRLIIILAMIGILSRVVFMPVGNAMMKKDYELTRERTEESLKWARMLKKKGKIKDIMGPALSVAFSEAFMNVEEKINNIIGYSVETINILYLLLVLVFFTRHRVKEQFK